MTKPVDHLTLDTATPAPDALALEAPTHNSALAFDPVPVRPRSNGWTAYRQRLFIRTLAETCSVSEACEAAGVTPRSAYRLRQRPGAESFDRAWARALDLGVQRLTTIAFDRAIHGTPRRIFHHGKEVAEEYIPSDRLLMYLLKHYDRSRYGNLSGLLPCDVPNPIEVARDALPALLDGLADQPSRPMPTRTKAS